MTAAPSGKVCSILCLLLLLLGAVLAAVLSSCWRLQLTTALRTIARKALALQQGGFSFMVLKGVKSLLPALQLTAQAASGCKQQLRSNWWLEAAKRLLLWLGSTSTHFILTATLAELFPLEAVFSLSKNKA